MLKELKNYVNLGTPAYFWEFLNLLKGNDIWTENTIREYFFNRVIDNRSMFDGCIPLLKMVKIISVNEETKNVTVNYEYRNILHTEKMCQFKLLEGILQALKEDDEFHNAFKNSHLDFLVHKSVIIDHSSFGLKYSNAKKLLIDFGFLLPHPEMTQKLIVNTKWKKFFDTDIAPKVRKALGIEELKKKLKKQEMNGEEAEKFVIEFEKRRLENKEGIEWIAPYDSAAGFDVLSFHNITSEENNRFIEVKSYAGNCQYFYWTKNEMKIANEKQSDYCIYLVNRDHMFQEDYIPEIIFNPTKNILNNDEWCCEVDKYYITSN